MGTLRIDHARLLSPGLDARGSLLVNEGQIIAVLPQDGGSPESLPAADRVFDAQGGWLVPGFMDIHSHGAHGHDTCDGTEVGIRGVAEAKLREGVTTWLPTTLTLPAAALEAAFQAVAAYAANPSGALTPGIHFEGPFINPGATGAQNPAFVRPPDLAEVDALHGIFPMRIVSLAPEMPGAVELCAALRARGIVPSAAHTKASRAQILAAEAQGLGHLTHFCNQMTPLHHREVGVVGAGLLSDTLMIEMITDRIHLCDDMVRLVWALKPADQLMLITDSMRASWLPDGQKTQLGGLPVIVQDGAARLDDGSGALAGSTALFHRLFFNVLEITGLAPARVVGATAANQARSLGFHDRGRLQPGLRADLALLDPERQEIRATWVGGELKFGG